MRQTPGTSMALIVLLAAPALGGSIDEDKAPDFMVCRPDGEKLCRDTAPGDESGMGRCLRSHRDQLSPECRDYMDKRSGAWKSQDAWAEACGGDLARLCPGIDPGDRRIRQCVQARWKDLSEGCRAASAKGGRSPEQLRAADNWDQACGQDAERLCAGIEPADGGLAKCLRERWDQVSKPCRAYHGDRADPEDGQAVKETWKDACQAEIDKLCKETVNSGGRVADCMLKQYSQLSPGCVKASGMTPPAPVIPPNKVKAKRARKDGEKPPKDGERPPKKDGSAPTP